MDIDLPGLPCTIDPSTAASELWRRTHHTCVETKTTVDGSVPPPCMACLTESSIKFAVTPIDPTLPSGAFGYVRPLTTVVPAQVTYVGPWPLISNVCPGCGRCRDCGRPTPCAAPHVPLDGAPYPFLPSYPVYPWQPGLGGPFWQVDPLGVQVTCSAPASSAS